MHSIHKNLNQQSRMDSSVLNYLSTTTIGIVIPLLVIISCLLLFHPSKVGNVREPPMVGGAWPVIGHLPLLSKSKTPHKTLAAIADKYGPLFTIKLGAKQVLVLSNWEMAKECFTKNDKLVSTRPKLVSIENLSYNKAMFGLAPYGPYWRELRKIVTLELLCNRRIELLRHVRVSEVEASIKGLFNLWSSRKNELGYVLVEMKHWFAQLTFNVVLRMIVGKRFFGVMDLENEENGERIVKIMRDFLRMFGVFPVADAVPSLRWLDLGGHEKVMKEIAKELDEIMCEWLDEHRQNRGLNQKDDASDQDFMDVMLSLLNDAKIDQFDADTIIKATALSMILGGTDTTSVTLTWTMSLLMRNPDVLKKAKEELDSQIGKERCVSETDINNLVYLQAIVKETLRLYPAAPLVGIREFTEDCILGGYHVKKGTRLMTNLWKIHTDPSIWSDPLEFKPERFLSTHKDVDFRGQHFEFVPFGSGRRMCPGVSFGLQIVHFTLARFLHCFDILNPSSEPVDMTETLGLTNEKATPLEILVKPCLSPGYETM